MAGIGAGAGAASTMVRFSGTSGGTNNRAQQDFNNRRVKKLDAEAAEDRAYQRQRADRIDAEGRAERREQNAWDRAIKTRQEEREAVKLKEVDLRYQQLAKIAADADDREAKQKTLAQSSLGTLVRLGVERGRPVPPDVIAHIKKDDPTFAGLQGAYPAQDGSFILDFMRDGNVVSEVVPKDSQALIYQALKWDVSSQGSAGKQTTLNTAQLEALSNMAQDSSQPKRAAAAQAQLDKYLLKTSGIEEDIVEAPPKKKGSFVSRAWNMLTEPSEEEETEIPAAEEPAAPIGPVYTPFNAGGAQRFNPRPQPEKKRK